MTENDNTKDSELNGSKQALPEFNLLLTSL
jgi:hypothetical protein